MNSEALESDFAGTACRRVRRRATGRFFLSPRFAVLTVLLQAGLVAAAEPITYFEKRLQSDGKGSSITYGLARPRPFNAGQKYPMVVALHGMAPAQPNSLDKISGSIECNVWARDDQQAQHPCFVLCPMTPIPTWDGTPYHSWTLTWDGKSYPGYSPAVCPKMADTIAFPARCVKLAIDSVLREFPQVDPNRIYLVGGSMGGVGAYCMAVRWPRLFAALFPIAGLCDTSRACSLKAMPLWAVHGTGDDLVSTTADSLFVKAIIKCGGNPRRSWIAGAGHGPFDHFGREEYHTWLFAQSKTSTAVAAPVAQALVSNRSERASRIMFGVPSPGSRSYTIQGRSVAAEGRPGATDALRPQVLANFDEAMEKR